MLICLAQLLIHFVFGEQLGTVTLAYLTLLINVLGSLLHLTVIQLLSLRFVLLISAVQKLTVQGGAR